MPRRKQDAAVEKRAQEILAEQGQRRRKGARKAAATRRQGRPEAQAEAQDQSGAKRATRAKRERKERKPRVHADLLTVAFRGPLAGHFRELAEQHQMSLSALLQDAMLSWEQQVAAGYQPGTAMGEWKAQQGPEATQA